MAYAPSACVGHFTGSGRLLRKIVSVRDCVVQLAKSTGRLLSVRYSGSSRCSAVSDGWEYIATHDSPSHPPNYTIAPNGRIRACATAT
jgi:hypothetical protein